MVISDLIPLLCRQNMKLNMFSWVVWWCILQYNCIFWVIEELLHIIWSCHPALSTWCLSYSFTIKQLMIHVIRYNYLISKLVFSIEGKYTYLQVNLATGSIECILVAVSWYHSSNKLCRNCCCILPQEHNPHQSPVKSLHFPSIFACQHHFCDWKANMLCAT